MPNTIIIYDQFGEAPLGFTVVKGDKSHLDQIFINSTKCEQTLQDELMELMYKPSGAYNVHLSTRFPRTYLINNPDTKVIVCGFLP